MTKQKSRSDEKRITLRLPKDIYDELTKAAERDVRSLNAEIVFLLQRALQSQSQRKA